MGSRLTPCPCCLGSSGLMPWVNGGGPGTCGLCKGKGFVTTIKAKRFNEDPIKELADNA
jgi:DnaJ-class molecular chaperone